MRVVVESFPAIPVGKLRNLIRGVLELKLKFEPDQKHLAAFETSNYNCIKRRVL